MASEDRLSRDKYKENSEEQKESSYAKNDDLNMFNKNLQGLNFERKFIGFNRHQDQDFNPFDIFPFLHQNRFEYEVNNKLMRSLSMSPTNNRLTRSYSSDIPQYINQRPKGFWRNDNEPLLFDNKQLPDIQLDKNDKFCQNKINVSNLTTDVDAN